MRAELAVGVARSGRVIALAAMRRGGVVMHGAFPSTALGAEAIRIYLADCAEPVRLAVGCAELGLAVGWMCGRDRETIVVSNGVATDASVRARHAAGVL